MDQLFALESITGIFFRGGGALSRRRTAADNPAALSDKRPRETLIIFRLSDCGAADVNSRGCPGGHGLRTETSLLLNVCIRNNTGWKNSRFLNVTKVTSHSDSRERNNHSLGVGGMRRVGCSKQKICHMNSSRGINLTFASFSPLVFSFISFLFASHTSSTD